MSERRSPRPPFANALFFPVAALYSAVAVALWALALAGFVPAPPGLTTPAGHAHELLFGYALAVVAGYLLGPQPMRITLVLLALWALARVTFLLWPGSVWAAVSATLFAAGVAIKVVPRFSHAAKKWRNRSVAPLVAALALVATAAAAAIGMSTVVVVYGLLIEAVLLLAALLFFMGGRILAPALAGHVRRHGGFLPVVVQPALEGAVLIALAAALLLQPLPFATSQRLAGALALLAGLLTMLRLLRWRPWLARTQPDLLLLMIGYGWLALGLMLIGCGLLIGWPARAVGVHALTVGALGTLTVAVMARTRLLYRFRDANLAPAAHVAAVLMSVAALARVAPGLSGIGGGFIAWQLTAALGWCLAQLLLVPVLLRTVRVTRGPGGLKVD